MFESPKMIFEVEAAFYADFFLVVMWEGDMFEGEVSVILKLLVI